MLRASNDDSDQTTIPPEEEISIALSMDALLLSEGESQHFLQGKGLFRLRDGQFALVCAESYVDFNEDDGDRSELLLKNRFKSCIRFDSDLKALLPDYLALDVEEVFKSDMDLLKSFFLEDFRLALNLSEDFQDCCLAFDEAEASLFSNAEAKVRWINFIESHGELIPEMPGSPRDHTQDHHANFKGPEGNVSHHAEIALLHHHEPAAVIPPAEASATESAQEVGRLERIVAIVPISNQAEHWEERQVEEEVLLCTLNVAV